MTQTIPTWKRGERMAKAREEAGLSQIEMGDRLGVSGKTISSWETETRQPRGMMRILETWAEITNVPLWWLLDLGERSSPWNSIPARQGTLDEYAAEVEHDTALMVPEYALAS